MADARVVFTATVQEIAELDIAVGPCVPATAGQRPLVSPYSQWPDAMETMQALFTALTGRPPGEAWTTMTAVGRGQLVRFADEYVEALCALSRRARAMRNYAELVREFDAVAVPWLRTAPWPADQLAAGLRSRLALDCSQACLAQERGQTLYCWFGPEVSQDAIA